jgi:hypothetical protein
MAELSPHEPPSSEVRYAVGKLDYDGYVSDLGRRRVTLQLKVERKKKPLRGIKQDTDRSPGALSGKV